MSVDSPLMQALLACDIASIELEIGDEALDEWPLEDFVLRSVLSEAVSLTIEHDSQEGVFRVRSAALLDELDRPQGAILALSLNHAGRDGDRFSMTPSDQALHFTRTLRVVGLDLEEFAFALYTAMDVALALLKLELPETLLEESAPPERPLGAPILRG